jgi:hypothetical protein
MRKLLTLTCCVGLASIVGAAPQDGEQVKERKKGGGNNAPPPRQTVASQTGKKFKTGPTGGQHHPNVQNFQQPNTVGNYNTLNKKGKWQGPVTGQDQTGLNNPNQYKHHNGQFQNNGNLSGSAASTQFNKSKKFGMQGQGNTNDKFQKKHFNLQTNNTQFVVNKYKTVNYNKNYKFVGFYGGNPANWGTKYVVFANYQPVWHDQWWWTSHHSHIVFIFGGWYYWDNSYWYPAWGYAPNSIYVYDGPIYGSNPSEDPGQIVANVQAALQQQGYYQGDIDGILGPQTRAALAEYQSAQGLETTGAVDEPTLESLGMA